MQEFIPFAILFLGLLLVSVVTVFFMRARFAAMLSAALNESHINDARLNERLQNVQEENRRLEGVIDENADDFHALRSQLNDSQNERAQLMERVSRINVLEKEKNQLAIEKEVLSNQSNELHANIATLTSSSLTSGTDLLILKMLFVSWLFTITILTPSPSMQI